MGRMNEIQALVRKIVDCGILDCLFLKDRNEQLREILLAYFYTLVFFV